MARTGASSSCTVQYPARCFTNLGTPSPHGTEYGACFSEKVRAQGAKTISPVVGITSNGSSAGAEGAGPGAEIQAHAYWESMVSMSFPIEFETQ